MILYKYFWAPFVTNAKYTYYDLQSTYKLLITQTRL